MHDQERSPSTQIDTSGLEGIRLRTDTPIRGIARVIVKAAPRGLQVWVASVMGSDPADWGTTRVEAIYAVLPESKTAAAFTARFELPSLNVELHANLSKGLLIIASMARFRDGRLGQFAGDFFRKV